MIANKGQLHGVRILAPSTVELMQANALPMPLPPGFALTMPWMFSDAMASTCKRPSIHAVPVTRRAPARSAGTDHRVCCGGLTRRMTWSSLRWPKTDTGWVPVAMPTSSGSWFIKLWSMRRNKAGKDSACGTHPPAARFPNAPHWS